MDERIVECAEPVQRSVLISGAFEVMVYCLITVPVFSLRIAGKRYKSRISEKFFQSELIIAKAYNKG